MSSAIRKPSPFRTAAKIAWRETQASTGRFVFVILAVAAGVAALSGVRGFSQAFHTMLQRDARTFMAADLTVRTFELETPKEKAAIDALVARGVQRTQITETVTMAMPPNANPETAVPVLISVKAVDPRFYPFYGKVTLDPAQSLLTALTADTVVVSDGVLLRLGAKIGDSITIGGKPFRIVGQVTNEPDRMTGSINVGPRVMISREGLERTGLIMPGSRASERFLFKVPVTMQIGDVRAELTTAFEANSRGHGGNLISDYTEAHPLIEQGLRQSTIFLSLVSLVALVIGALGVATAIQAHLQQKMDSIAIMKCLGAKSSQILRIYLIQTIGLGLVGSAVGIAFGAFVQSVFPIFLSGYFHLTSLPRFSPLSALQGLLVGVLTVLLFTVPPLLEIRTIRPALIFRREMAAPGRTFGEWWRRAAVSVVSALVILFFVGLLAAWLSDSAQTGQYFAMGIAVGLAALAVIAWLLLRGLRWVSRHLPRAAGPVLRQGIANLYRPGNHAGAAVIALGVGVMFTVSVWIIQRGVLHDMMRTAPPGLPNVYLIDVTAANRDGVMDILKHQAGVLGSPEMTGSVSARIQSIDGVAMRRESQQGMARRYAGNVSLSQEGAIPQFTQVMDGKWWDEHAHPATPEVSVAEQTAKLLNVHVGSKIVWTTPARTFESTVVAIHKTQNERLTARIEFFFAPGALDGLPAIYYGGVRMKPESVGALQKAIYDKYPTITVINMADVLEIIQSVVDQISMVVRFISGFSMLAGAVILASSVAGTRFRRLREVVILKTLGATRARIAKIFSVEFFVIGTVAGLMGGMLAGGFGWVLLNQLLKAETGVDIVPVLTAIGGTALLAVATGWLASYRTLGQKPLEILRDE
ncbi:MAG TPA: FtsX-like permease family protein [Bryobacteraceae bacterium]